MQNLFNPSIIKVNFIFYKTNLARLHFDIIVKQMTLNIFFLLVIFEKDYIDEDFSLKKLLRETFAITKIILLADKVTILLFTIFLNESRDFHNNIFFKSL